MDILIYNDENKISLIKKKFKRVVKLGYYLRIIILMQLN